MKKLTTEERVKELVEELAKKINQLIGERTTYGIRLEEAKVTGYVIIWSNARRAWWVVGGKINKGEMLHLDANQLLVPGLRREVDAVLDMLDALPLYANSFEARSL